MIITLFSVIVAVAIFMVYIIFNLSRKLEIYEDFCQSMLDETTFVLGQIESIDIRKSFETDDEVGIIYTSIRSMVLRLKAFLGPE